MKNPKRKPREWWVIVDPQDGGTSHLFDTRKYAERWRSPYEEVVHVREVPAPTTKKRKAKKR